MLFHYTARSVRLLFFLEREKIIRYIVSQKKKFSTYVKLNGMSIENKMKIQEFNLTEIL
jgi:hypothetical protein